MLSKENNLLGNRNVPSSSSSGEVSKSSNLHKENRLANRNWIAARHLVTIRKYLIRLCF